MLLTIQKVEKGLCSLLFFPIVLVTFWVATASSLEPHWPLRSKVDLSSGFGDFREGRFHTGLDIRTGGRTGQWVISPVDGYVWRVKMSYEGYGKGLYVKGDDGYVYVLAHLSGFNSKIQRHVQLAQMAAERYYLDIYFPRDSIRVERAEIIALSGKTGVGAPHLHFERRSPDNVPLNPLTETFLIDDSIAPTISRIGFHLMDDHSLFPDGRRKLFLDISEKGSDAAMQLTPIQYMDRPFGIMVDCFDKMRAGGMKQTVYHLTLTIDDLNVYEVRLDSLPFELGKNVYHEYEYVEAANDRKHVRRLFAMNGNDYTGSRAHSGDRGIIGASLTNGKHTATITARDNSGNSTRLNMDFIWNGLGDLYRLDSVVQVDSLVRRFYFAARGELTPFKLTATTVEQNRGTNWKSVTFAQIIEQSDSGIVMEWSGRYDRTRGLRLTHSSAHGLTIHDQIFHGLLGRGQKGIHVTYEVLDDGLAVTAESNALFGIQARLMLFDNDSLLGVELPDKFVSIKKYLFFVPPRPEYRRVSRLAVALAAEGERMYPEILDSLHLAVIGIDAIDSIALGDSFVAIFSRDDLFAPRFIDVRKAGRVPTGRSNLNSGVYQILPEVFAVKNEFPVHINLSDDGALKRNDHSGLYWLDQKKNRWIWLSDSLSQDNTVIGHSIGGGIFAALYEMTPPVIKARNLVNGRVFDSSRPTFEFILSDTLSGIADDLSIRISIDDRWMIPEYDPEDEICTTQPIDPLSDGEHVIRFEAVDRAGNRTLEGWRFIIRTLKQAAKDGN